jgi:class 3 adenylate cyclase/TolB-like protein/Flp pilus assembly protein TadD
MPASWLDSPLDLQRQTKVILVVDVVESVRLMEQDEHGFIQRWQQFVRAARQQVLPAHGGRMHKSLGDGLMLEFGDAPAAVRGALALQELSTQVNQGAPAERQMLLRMGAHIAQFVADEHDIYGTDVNLTARMATLAGPGEIVVTGPVLDQLTDGIDAEVEDLGDCHLKHVAEPVRAYRIGAAGPAPVLTPSAQHTPLQPAIAVIPFESRGSAPEHFAVGELIAEGLIAQMGRTSQLRVISRLSTTAFRGRQAGAPEISRVLGSTYVLSGSYVAVGERLLVSAELADARNNEVVWSQRLQGEIGDLLQAESELCHEIASMAHTAIMRAAVQRALVRPLPTLESCSLLLGGISLTHRASSRDFGRARDVLEALVDRHPRSALARAWLAKWYILKVVRGLSESPDTDSRRAIEQTERALDAENDSALALAIQGHALCQLSKDVDGALDRINQALELSPNDPLAWLYKSVWSSMWGSTGDSVREAEVATRLSPIDPMKYYYDMILASGLSVNGQYERSIDLARRSLRANKHHQPTLRVLLYALHQTGRIEEARQTLDLLRAETPNLTVSSYLGSGGAASAPRQRLAGVLRQLGVPEH